MNEDVLTGRCLCGAIRYRCGPRLYAPTLCHCESCRRASGAHAVGWLTVSSRDFLVTAGAPAAIESSPGVRREFCGRCGAPLTYRNASRPDEVDVTLGTLDEPGRAPPADHIWMEDAPSWDRPADGLPCHARSRAT
ncbi:MAG: GFA family protein [Proteobacteria bacterium]|nr:GFA family protein [Pseudomonadota bacterium]